MTHHPKQFKHQAAGHGGTLTDTSEQLIFKPTIQQEIDFYNVIQMRLSDNPDQISLNKWMPAFLGNLQEGDLTLHETDCVSDPYKKDDKIVAIPKSYVVLENLLYGFHKPNIMDVKLGKILYDQNTSLKKRERLENVSNTTTSGTLGFRICGMKLQPNSLCDQLNTEHFSIDQDNYISINKKYGKVLTKENIHDGFRLYFDHDELSAKRRLQLLKIFLTRLKLLRNTLMNEEVRMISSSLLFIYEGDPNRWNELHDKDTLFQESFIDEDSTEESKDVEHVSSSSARVPLSSMSLIDFAHSTLEPGKGYDKNIIEGINNLIEIISQLL